MTLHRAYRESVDKQIFDFFYSGLSISSVSKKMKEHICDMDSNIKTLGMSENMFHKLFITIK